MIPRTAALAWLCGAVLLAACRARPDHRRVLVFGIDGAGFELTRTLMDAGELPNLARLRERGAFGPLLSIEPMLSPALWTSIATGMRPEKHGIAGFTADGSDSSEGPLHTSRLLRVRRLWDIAGDAGWSVGVVNWWATWPATPVRGFLLSNLWPTSRNMIRELEKKQRGLPGGIPLAAGHDTSTWPPELRDEIARFIVEDEDIAPAELEALHLSRESYRFVWDLPEMKSHTDAGLHLYAQRLPDLFLIYYWILDHVEHQYFGTDPEPVRRVYRRLDEILGRFLALAGPDAVVAVMSDHGFRAIRGRGAAIVEHGPLGILLLSGPGIRSGAAIARASLLDVTPTLLAAMGLPTARDMDGRALTELFEPGSPAAAPSSIASYEGAPLPEPLSPEAVPFEAELKQRLRALGYLDQDAPQP